MVEEFADNEENGGSGNELDMGALMAEEFGGLEEGKLVKARVIKINNACFSEKCLYRRIRAGHCTRM